MCREISGSPGGGYEDGHRQENVYLPHFCSYETSGGHTQNYTAQWNDCRVILRSFNGNFSEDRRTYESEVLTKMIDTTHVYRS